MIILEVWRTKIVHWSMPFIQSNAVVAWSLRKQSIVTLSTIKAEFIATSACMCQMVWIKRLLKKLGYDGSSSPIIFYGNNSTIKLSKTLEIHRKSKHIYVWFHFLHDMANEGTTHLSSMELKIYSIHFHQASQVEEISAS